MQFKLRCIIMIHTLHAFDSGLDDCRHKVGQVLRMFSALVHLQQFEKVVRQINSRESRLQEPFVKVKAFQQWREGTTLHFGGMQLRLRELQQEVRTLVASHDSAAIHPIMILALLIVRVNLLFFCNNLMQCLTIYTCVRLDWMHPKTDTHISKLKWDKLRALTLLLHG